MNLVTDYDSHLKKRHARLILVSMIFFGISMVAAIAYIIWISGRPTLLH
jgi:phage shock protein PspC (stress-responsive transcriptional regulator)